MNKFRICLLVTDDPDEQLEFTEALDQLTDEVIILTVTASEKALYLIKEKIMAPDFLFLNLTIDDMNSKSWAAYLAQNPLPMNIITYGAVDIFENLVNNSSMHFINNDYSFFQLRNFIKQLINP